MRALREFCGRQDLGVSTSVAPFAIVFGSVIVELYDFCGKPNSPAAVMPEPSKKLRRLRVNGLAGLLLKFNV